MRARVFFALASAAVLAFLPLVQAAAYEKVIVSGERPVIVEIDFGTARIKQTDTDSWIDLSTGQIAFAGDEISSGSDSRITILFFDGSVMQVEQDTHVRIVESSSSDTGSTTLKVFQLAGNTLSRVAKLFDSASVYAVQTPAGVGLVRGTQFKITVHPDGSTDVRTAEGVVELTKSEDQPGVEVTAGHMSSVGPSVEDTPEGPRAFELTDEEHEELETLQERGQPNPQSLEIDEVEFDEDDEDEDVADGVVASSGSGGGVSSGQGGGGSESQNSGGNSGSGGGGNSGNNGGGNSSSGGGRGSSGSGGVP